MFPGKEASSRHNGDLPTAFPPVLKAGSGEGLFLLNPDPSLIKVCTHPHEPSLVADGILPH